MPSGYMGQVLRVDLSKEKIWIEKLDDNFYRRYLGGWGTIGYYLLKETPIGVDPLGPENVLIFASGVVTGLPFSGSGRNAIGAKSPLTYGFGAAEVGGYWGTELKRAGLDAVVVKGRSQEPIYLWIYDGKAELRDAKHLWGKETQPTMETICQELGDESVRVAQIGPAGENIVRLAAITCDLKHAAGRCGLGAVMGSKNLKAVAVRGHSLIESSDKDTIKALSSYMAKNFEQFPYPRSLHEFGTGEAMDVFEATGNLPVRNFQGGSFLGADLISARTIKNKIRVGMSSCYACVIRCKKEVEIGEPWCVDRRYGGPEYESIAALGSDCSIDSLEAICKASELCERYGLDTISTGATIAFAMECYANHLIRREETDGLPLDFGNVSSLLSLVEKIARRKGVGNLLADGVKATTRKIGKGAEKYAIHVKGLEVPMHEPRLKKGLGLGYCVSPTGADHCHNLHDTHIDDTRWSNLRSLGILEKVSSEDLGSAKVRLLMNYMNIHVANNCLVICDFVPWTEIQKVEIVKAATGWNFTLYELMRVAERSLTLARIFNMREGLTSDDDWLPARFFEPPIEGPLAGVTIDSQQLKRARSLYYEMMGWNPDTGVPKSWKLSDLDIEWAKID